jgi:hypothetical protein
MKYDTESLYKIFVATFSHIGHKILIKVSFYVFDVH